MSEALFRLGRYDDETSRAGRETLWRALSHHRLDRREAARAALEGAATRDETSAYALTSSAPELERLARHYAEQEMPELARLHREVAEIVGGDA